jgi:agmatinase
MIIRGFNPELNVNPFEVLSCVDYGDVSIVPGSIERSYQAIEQELTTIADAGVVPILLGGDHSCTLAHLRASRARGPLAVIMFDSHTDAWDSFFGEKYNHGTWMRRAVEEGLVDSDHSIEVGLRGSLYSADDWSALPEDLGLAYVSTTDILKMGPDATADLILDRVAGHMAFISFDIDVIDPAYAPGTGTPEVGGLSSHQGLELIRGLRGIDFAGCDVVEVIPAYDPAAVTAWLAAHLAFEMISLLALRRLGQ